MVSYWHIDKIPDGIDLVIDQFVQCLHTPKRAFIPFNELIVSTFDRINQ